MAKHRKKLTNAAEIPCVLTVDQIECLLVGLSVAEGESQLTTADRATIGAVLKNAVNAIYPQWKSPYEN